MASPSMYYKASADAELLKMRLDVAMWRLERIQGVLDQLKPLTNDPNVSDGFQRGVAHAIAMLTGLTG